MSSLVYHTLALSLASSQSSPLYHYHLCAVKTFKEQESLVLQ